MPLRTFLLSAVLVSAGCTPKTPARTPEPSLAEEGEALASPPTETLYPEVTEKPLFEAQTVAVGGHFLPPLPRAVTSFGAAIAANKLVLAGGYFGKPHAYSKEGQSDVVWTLDLSPQGEASDQSATTDARWEPSFKLERGVQGLVALTYGTRTCFFGGSEARNAESEPSDMHSSRNASCLEISTGQPSQLPPLPEGRSSHGGAMIGSTVYLAGGWTLAGEPGSGTFAKSLLSLDLSAKQPKWIKVKAPVSRRALGVTSIDSKLVLVGGLDDAGAPSRKVNLFEPATGEWTEGPDYPQDAFGIAVATASSPKGTERVYASGRDGALYSWAPSEEAWVEERELAFPRFFHELVPSGSELIALGGISGMHTHGRTRLVERIPLDSAASFSHITITYPGAAKNRQGLFIEGEELFLFGGNTGLGQHDFGPESFTNQGWGLRLPTLTFRERAPYPVARQSMKTLSLESKGLAVGGFGHERPAEAPTSSPHPDTSSAEGSVEKGESQAMTQREVFSYSFASNEWKRHADLPEGRTQFGLTNQDEELWILGGLNYDPSRESPFQHVQELLHASDEASAFTSTAISLAEPRRAFAGAELDGKYYLIGGMKAGFALVDTCAVFDLSKQTFASLPCPAARLSGDLIAAGGKLYLVGGSVKTADGLEDSRQIEVFDPTTSNWSKMEFQLPLSTRHLRALPYRDYILLVSTHHEKAQMTLGVLGPF